MRIVLPGRRLGASLLGVFVFVLALGALHHLSSEVSLKALQRELHSMPAVRVLLAIFAAACSYALLTAYDAIGVAASGRNLRLSTIARVAFVANAFGHSLGMAPLTGGSVRMRSYARHGLDATAAAAVIATATLGFALGSVFWLGAALLFEAGTVARAVKLPLQLLSAAGIALWVVLAAAVLWRPSRGAAIRWRGHAMPLPSRRTTLMIAAVSVAELACAAATFYALLPADIGVSFHAFVGMYVLAVAVGLVSTVPAGLGVFEATLIVLLAGVPTASVLAANVLYRGIYYALPLLVALLLLAVDAGRSPMRVVGKRVRQVGRWSEPLLPLASAFVAFVAGAILLVSGSLPLAASAKAAQPLAVIEVSHLVGSLAGVVLLLLARGLAQQLRLAWLLSIAALAIGLVAGVLVHLHVYTLLSLALAGAWLLSGRHRFFRLVGNYDRSASLRAWCGAALVVAASVWVGLFAYRHVAYSHELWWQFAADGNAPRMLRASLMVVVLLGVTGGILLLRPAAVPMATASRKDRDRAAGIVSSSSRAGAALALVPDKQLMFADDERGMLMYQRSGPCLVAMGDPIGDAPTRTSLAWSFRELAHESRLWPVFYEVSADDLPLYLDLGLHLAKLGEEAVVPLPSFSLEGPGRAGLRQEHRHAIRAGCSFEMHAPESVGPLLPELRRISDEWLQGKASSEKGFSLGYYDEEYLARGPVGCARCDGRLVAFANVWRCAPGGELSVDLMRQTSASPRSTMDFLLIELMLWGKAQGHSGFNLGMAPLTGLSAHELAPLWHKLGGFAWRHGERFYGFEGLRRYKAKFQPDWRPRYLAAPGGMRMGVTLFHVSRLIAGGTRQLLF